MLLPNHNVNSDSMIIIIAPEKNNPAHLHEAQKEQGALKSSVFLSLSCLALGFAVIILSL
jgi:hypothetical protein